MKGIIKTKTHNHVSPKLPSHFHNLILTVGRLLERLSLKCPTPFLNLVLNNIFFVCGKTRLKAVSEQT
jgi:hypothetical protein